MALYRLRNTKLVDEARIVKVNPFIIIPVPDLFILRFNGNNVIIPPNLPNILYSSFENLTPIAKNRYRCENLQVV